MPKHTHRYERVDIGVTKEYFVYRCTLPDCSHYLPEALVVGKKSKCWRCGEEFVLTKNLLFKKPHCENCIERKTDDATKEKVDKLLSEFLIPALDFSGESGGEEGREGEGEGEGGESSLRLQTKSD